LESSVIGDVIKECQQLKEKLENRGGPTERVTKMDKIVYLDGHFTSTLMKSECSYGDNDWLFKKNSALILCSYEFSSGNHLLLLVIRRLSFPVALPPPTAPFVVVLLPSFLSLNISH
jgi:hypothetical protein